MRTFVIGDIHGAHKALVQCFERSGFDRTQDRLIALGDVCDGWPEVKAAIDELLKIKHLVYVLGNHDQWALDWGRDGRRERIWLKQGGENTIRSYNGEMMTDEHVQFLSEAKLYFEEDLRLFVHAGIDPVLPLDAQDADTFLWDRRLIMEAFQKSQREPQAHFGPFRDIFLGHTPTLNFYVDKPMRLCNIWALDTGAGWDGGRLTIMNLETKEFWQSDQAQFLYPNEPGRSKS
jgi:serine/threonine protein phosphatase 1